MLDKYTQITLTPEEFEEALELGARRDAINVAHGVKHNKSFWKRMASLGPDAGRVFHQQGAIGEAIINNYFTRISTHYNIPIPDRTGWHAWTPEERTANAFKPDIEWLNREVEVKTAENFTRFGITKKVVKSRRPIIVVVPSVSGPEQWKDNGGQFSPMGWACGVIETAAYNNREAWQTLEAAWYDETKGEECRIVPFRELTLASNWARQQVADYLQIAA